MAKKCAPCTPAALVRAEFAAAKKTAKKAGSCEPMRRALEKLKPLVQLQAEHSPKSARFLFRELLSKEQQTQKVCRDIYQGKEHWVGFEGLGRTRRRKRR